MKTLFIFCFLSLLFVSCKDTAPNNLNTVYYYCSSHAMKFPENSDKNYVLYTDILEIIKDQDIIMAKAKEWSALVKLNCKNVKGCTGDLNTYNTRSEAQAQINILSEICYNNKYEIEKVEFK